MKKQIIYHIGIPILVTILFFVNAFTPVEVLGCVMRGAIALILALACGLTAIAAAITAIRYRYIGKQNANWWIWTTIILAVPVVALLKLA